MEHILNGSHQKLRTPDIMNRETKPPKIASILSQTYENFKLGNYNNYDSRMSLEPNQAKSNHYRMNSTQ